MCDLENEWLYIYGISLKSVKNKRNELIKENVVLKGLTYDNTGLYYIINVIERTLPKNILLGKPFNVTIKISSSILENFKRVFRVYIEIKNRMEGKVKKTISEIKGVPSNSRNVVSTPFPAGTFESNNILCMIIKDIIDCVTVESKTMRIHSCILRDIPKFCHDEMLQLFLTSYGMCVARHNGLELVQIGSCSSGSEGRNIYEGKIVPWEKILSSHKGES